MSREVDECKPLVAGPGGGPLVAACGGRLVIALRTPGATLDIDHAYLTPGAWGQVAAPHAGALGLPARRDIAAKLRDQGRAVQVDP